VSEPQESAAKTYVGFIWIGDQPGVRLKISAESPDEATAAVEAQYGKGHVVSLWNEDDASTQR
jgi:hypothetical protein